MPSRHLELLKVTRRQALKLFAIASAIAALGSTADYVAPKLKALAQETTQAGQDAGERLIPTGCGICRNHCNIMVRVKDGVVRAIYPNTKVRLGGKFVANNWGICPKGVAGVFHVYNPYRVKKPLKRTNPEKGMGVDPQWVEIEWEEALDEIANKLKEVRNKDPRGFIIQYGAGKYLWGDKTHKAFAKAFGSPNAIHRTTICEGGRHVADELTWGHHEFLPDLENTRLLVVIGANPSEAGQWARWLNKFIADAVDKGMRLIVVDPRLSQTAAKAHKWIPVRPGTDVVLLLAVAKTLIENGYVDEEFLVTYTDAPYLVGEDGKFLRDNDGNPLVWDTVTGQATPYIEGVKPALTGSYVVNGQTYKTAFQVFIDSLQDLTLQRAEEITGVPAETIHELALELGEEARIGSTVMIDGKEYRYRPVSFYAFRGPVTHEFGSQHWRAGWIVLMILGAVNAVGGLIIHKANPDGENMKPSAAEYPPSRVDLKGSVYYPHASHDIAQQVGYTLLDPEAYGLPYKPEAQIIIGTNRVFAAPNSQDQIEGYKKTWNVVIDVVLSETAELADIVIPDTTYLESWQWVVSARWNPYTEYKAIRQPVIEPLFNIKYGAVDFLIELSKRLGIYEDFIRNINANWGLNNNPLDPGNPNITQRDIVEHVWVESTGKAFDYALQNGFIAKTLTPEETYDRLKPFEGPGKPKMHFYAEQMVHSYEKVVEKVNQYNITNIDLNYYKLAYSPLPRVEHAFQSVRQGKDDYPFYLITFKTIYRRQSGDTAINPLLNELARYTSYNPTDENRVLIHPDTAAKLGIKDGDLVVVESKRGKITLKAKLTEGIRPDTVGVSYHYGHWSTGFPDYAKKGANPNPIMELRSDIISGEANFNDTKVKVYKAS